MIRDKDNGAKALLAQLSRDRTVTIGVHAVEGGFYQYPGSGQNITDIATIHEFGTATIPRRSFLSGWFDENRPAILAMLQKTTRGGKNLEQKVRLWALWCVGQIQKRIASRIPPPLKEATIKAKGSSVPLIDTGHLRSAITAYVNGRKV